MQDLNNGTTVHEDLDELQKLVDPATQPASEAQKKKRKRNKKKKNQGETATAAELHHQNRDKQHHTPLREKMSKSL